MLILFVAALPFRAAVQFSDGRRVPLRGVDMPDDDGLYRPDIFVDDVSVEIGSRARFLDRSAAIGHRWLAQVDGLATATIPGARRQEPLRGRDVFALVIRQFIQLAERNLGIDIYHLVFVVPPAISKADRSALAESGHIAGCGIVEFAHLNDLLAQNHGAEVGKRHLLVQHDWEQCRITVFRCRAADTKIESSRDLSIENSGANLVKKLLHNFGSQGEHESQVREFLTRALPQWTAADVAEDLVASQVGPPRPLYLPANLRRALAGQLIERILADIPQQIDWIHLHGSWCANLAGFFAMCKPSAQISVVRSSGDVLELAVPKSLPRPVLGGKVWADVLGEVSQGNARTTLLEPGAILPAIFHDEGFRSELFGGSVALFTDKDGRKNALARLAIPRLHAKRPYCRLRLRVLCDSEDFVVILCDLAIASNMHLFVYDRRAGVAQDVDSRIVQQVYRDAQLDRARA